MRAIVLGSAAGGGFPQWNCGSDACERARRDDRSAKRRTQASVAISADDRSWILLNASPDIGRQIEQTPLLRPRPGPRSSPIIGVVLTGAEVDAIAGLLTLRERQKLNIVATSVTHDVLRANPIFDVLAPDLVRRTVAPLDRPVRFVSSDDVDSGLSVELFSVPGKVPLHAERPGDTPSVEDGEVTVGCAITDGSATLLFIPSCAAISVALARRLRGADTVLFDGTLATENEMIGAGLGPKTGSRMGHMSVFGAGGTLASFDGLGVRRRVLIHLNNSNPILLEDSPEHEAVLAAGWIVAHDGMEFAW